MDALTNVCGLVQTAYVHRCHRHEYVRTGSVARLDVGHFMGEHRGELVWSSQKREKTSRNKRLATGQHKRVRRTVNVDAPRPSLT